MKRNSTLLVILFMLTSCVPLTFVSASGESLSFNTFTGGYATVEVDLQGGVVNNSASIEVPRNVTFTDSGFEVVIDSDHQSPGEVWVDVGEDGIFEWEFNGTGYGDIGQQNEFYDGNNWYVSQVPIGNSTSPTILIPSESIIQDSSLEVGFSPASGGGFFPIGSHQHVIETDIDGDSLPEPMFLIDVQSNNSTSIVWADWNLGSGLTMSTPLQTCDNATSISTGDVNGDGNDDIVAFSTSSSTACIHLANGTTFDPVLNQTISSGTSMAKMGDINSDGSDEIVTVTTGGTLSFYSWNNTTSGLSSPITEVVDQNGTTGFPAILLSVHVGDFFNTGNKSILVMDSTGHWAHWSVISGMLAGPLTTFDDISRDEILTDLDGDGDIDILGSNNQGYALRINNGTAWSLQSFQNMISLVNSTVADYDNDGNLELMTPVSSTSDGNSTTIEGNISLRQINSTNLSTPSMMVLEPWSIPTSILTMDMDGDGIIEQIVSAGETSKGVFIAGWHSIELDADKDGIPEMGRTGYAGDSTNGLAPLQMRDESNAIRQDLVLILSSLQANVDGYGISMANLSMNVKTTGNGEFNYTGLDIGYDCSFAVNQNPHLIGNLTNSLNQQMTGGVGNLTIEIPLNSTKSGLISLSNYYAVTIPGAPNLAIPVTPVLQLVSATPEMIEFKWNDTIEYGLDFIEFEIFKLESSSQSVNLQDVYNRSFFNQTIDSNVSVGSTYWYVVRSTHQYGIASNFSQPLMVTVPYPAPPSQLTGFSLNDVEADQGGVLSLSWEHSLEEFTEYEVYLETSEFTTVSGLNPILNISSSQNSTLLSGLIDGQGYWAAVVAVDQYGNKTEEVIPVGPTYPRNDEPNAVNLQLIVSTETSIGSPFDLQISAEVDGQEIIPPGDITITMQTADGSYPISSSWDNVSLIDFSELVSFAPDISGSVTFWANYSGDIGDEQTRPLASAFTSASTLVTVQATLTSSEEVYELDWENETSVRIDLSAVNPSQQSLMEGAAFTWVAYNSTTGTSTNGSGIIQNGFQQFVVTFNESGLLYVNLSGPSWIDAGSNSVQLSLVTYGTTVENNQSEGNTTTQTPWAPDVMLDATLDCGEVIIDPSKDQELDCSITNPNNYSVEISLEADGWSQWEDYILFEPTAGQGDFTLTEFESKNLEIRVEIVQDLRENGLLSGLIQVDLRQGPADYTSPGDKPQTYEIQWTLIEEDDVVEPSPQDNNTNQKTDTKDSSSSSDNTMFILGGVGGLALIGLAVFIVLRMRNSDFEDWDEDDLDMEPDVEAPQRASKPLPVGVALDEFEDKTIVDETPDRPDVINEFDDSDDFAEDSVGTNEEYFEEEYSEHNESDDSGISVDEHGTEWYEDEVGVWWYREEGQEDWSEFVDE